MKRPDALRSIQRLARSCAIGVLAATLALAPAGAVAVGGGPEILNGIVKDESDAEREGNSWFQGVHDAINRVKGPATVGLGAIVPLTLIVGGGCLAMGIRRGMQLIAIAIGSGALVLLGNGIAA